MPLPPPPRCLALLPRMAALVAVIGAVVLAGGVASVGAQVGATVEVTPAGAEPGEVIAIDGAGFPVGELVSLLFGELVIATARVDDAGAFQVLAAVPLNIAPGLLVIAVSGDAGSRFVLTYRVASPTPLPTAAAGGPTFEVLPSSALPGTTITVTGEGFGPGESVTVRFDGVELATVGATIGGAFLANVVVPLTASPGAHLIEVTGALGLQAGEAFSVLGPPTPPATAAPATPVATSEATPEVRATPTPFTGDATPTPLPGGGPGGASGAGGGDASAGASTGGWSEFPVLLVGALALFAAVLAYLYRARSVPA